jgi:hypothetical protein
LRQRTVTPFYANNFTFSKSLRPLMPVVCVLFVTALGLPPAHYRGFGVRLAGRCPAPAAVFQFGFCSGPDKHLSTFFCYLQLRNFFGLRFRGWTLKCPAQPQALSLPAMLDRHFTLIKSLYDLLQKLDDLK